LTTPVLGAERRLGSALRHVDAPGQLHPGDVTFRRRRRPSGEPPPLPRSLHRTGAFWAVVAGAALLFYIASGISEGLTSPGSRIDHDILRWFERQRTDGLTSVMKALHALGSVWVIRLLAYTGVLVPAAFKRFRHALLVFASILMTRALTAAIGVLVARPRPLGIAIIGDWEGFSHPSLPVATLAAASLGTIYALVPRGIWRQAAKWMAGLLILALGVSRVYLGVDNPFDVVFGVVFGVAIPVVAFRMLAPYEVFPVRYRRGRSAHLDVTGRRGDAIRQALEQQLGVVVRDLRPFGLGGSAGSTPLRIELEDRANTVVFGKLYAANHLRADRSYKLVRTLRYGRLEDESSFSTVRRLVQYEDYLLRVMRAADIPVAEPYGFVELTPEREYLLVTEFCSGADEIGEVEITDAVIDNSLAVVRRMWETGLAHRDVKPSNVLVRGDEVHLIDVAFGEVRPSPWRQAVDLANMMLTLSLGRTPEEIYKRALLQFTPDEIAEAFAATRGVTSPSQLRGMMRAQGRDLIREFRQLAPPRPPIKVQRWSVRRLGLTSAVLFGSLIFLAMCLSLLHDSRLL
jgi:membrane-associated phospholipid phosphatase/tRNA A-37 threonylcarbamoyl transferase component Bud32